MKRLIPLVLTAFLAASASAQSSSEFRLNPIPGRTALPTPTVTIVPELVEGPTQNAQVPAAALAKNYITLAYYNTNNPTLSVHLPTRLDTVDVMSISQRFTLPTESGILDSVKMHFDSVDGDNLMLHLFKDTIWNGYTGDKPLHYKNTWPGGIFHGAILKMTGFKNYKNFTIKIPLGHVKVPKEFHIGISTAEFGGIAGLSEFTYYGEAHFGRTASLDTSRSGALWTPDHKLYWIDQFDGLFQAEGQPLGMDFHIDAIVDISQADVATTEVNRTAVYPNPVMMNQPLRVSHGDMMSSISLINMLGAEVLNWNGSSNNAELSTAGLAKGIYTLLITTDSGVSSEKVIVQ
jgi:hypothetical protein